MFPFRIFRENILLEKSGVLHEPFIDRVRCTFYALRQTGLCLFNIDILVDCIVDRLKRSELHSSWVKRKEDEEGAQEDKGERQRDKGHKRRRDESKDKGRRDTMRRGEGPRTKGQRGERTKGCKEGGRASNCQMKVNSHFRFLRLSD